MASKVQQYTVSHTGAVLGEEYVTLAQNQTSPQRPTAVLTLEGPKQFERLSYVGSRDATRFVPRALETFDGDGTETTFNLTGDIQPISGETDVDDQDYPVVVAYDTDADSQLTVESVDYAIDEVTFTSAPNTGTDNVKIWHILNEGTVQYRLLNQFGQVEGHVYPWPTPIYRWHDFEQLKRGTQINLMGGAEWSRYETLEVVLDSPREIVWEDDDYPEGEYVSTFEQDLNIHL